MNQDIPEREWARRMIQTAGLRATTARVATPLMLRDSSAPLTHAEVSVRLTDLEIDKATVFRNLNDMATFRLLRRSELGDHVWRFEIIYDEESAHSSHPHFVCVNCGSVFCMEEIELTNRSPSVSKRFGQVTEILLRSRFKFCNA